MSKPVTPQEIFDFWQKMVNPGAYPLQSLMFPVLDARELDKKISDLETVQHWLKANLSMLQLTIRSLEFQRELVKGGEAARDAMAEGAAKAREAVEGEGGEGSEIPNPALWAFNLMAQAGREAMESAAKATAAGAEAGAAKGAGEGAAARKPRARKRRARKAPPKD